MYQLPPQRQRTRLQIMADILEIAKSGAKKTHLVYRCNLNHGTLNFCLKFLLETGLMEEVTVENNKRLYQTTQIGKEMLANYRELASVLKEASKDEDFFSLAQT